MGHVTRKALAIVLMISLLFSSFMTLGTSYANAADENDNKPSFEFGLVADIQYSDHDTNGTRYYRNSVSKLTYAAETFNQHDLDFTVQLGDIIDRDLSSFSTILPIFNKIEGPKYHVLGNHDFPVTTDKVADILGMRNQYYDFSRKGWRFVVLDTNDLSLYANAEGSDKYQQAQTMYNSLKESGASNAQTWNGGISNEQLTWLHGVLSDAAKKNEKVAVFAHMPVYPENMHNVWNGDALIHELESAGNVVAYFNGHNHAGNYAQKNGIHYVNFQGMVDTPDTNAYSIIRVFKDRLEIDGYGREPDHVLPIGSQPIADLTKLPQQIALAMTTDPQTSISINWTTIDTTLTDAKVTVWEKGANEKTAIPFSATIEKRQVSNSTIVDSVYQAVYNPSQFVTEKNFYSATITGLKPDTEYSYRCGTSEIMSEARSFKTAQANEDEYTFIYISDSQVSGNHSKGWNANLDIAKSKYPNAKFIYIAGDLTDKAANEGQWESFFNQPGNAQFNEKFSGSLISELPVAAAMGNHDSTGGGIGGMSSHFTWGSQVNGVPVTYAFDYGAARMIIINAENAYSMNNETARAAQTEFLRSEVSKAKAEGKWTIVGFHKSIYSGANHMDDSDVIFNRKYWSPIFAELNVDAVLQGHDHVLSRGFVKGDGTKADVTQKVTDRVYTADQPQNAPLYYVGNTGSTLKFYAPLPNNDWIQPGDPVAPDFGYLDINSALPAGHPLNPLGPDTNDDFEDIDKNFVRLPTFTAVTVSKNTIKYETYMTGFNQDTNTIVKDTFLYDSLTVKKQDAPNPNADKIFDLVEVTDFHGQLLDSTGKLYVGAALSKAVKDIKGSNPDRTLILGGGDLYQGTPISNVLRGVPVQEVFSDMGMNVTALGNHEFDWGLNTTINTTMNKANYEILCANLYKKGTNERVFNPYKVINKGGVKIAVIGAIKTDTPTIILPAYAESYDFKDAAAEINSVAKSIRDNHEADVVLVVVHEGGDPLNQIVAQLHGVNAVFGGHSHSVQDNAVTDADGKSVPVFNARNGGKGYVNVKMTVSAKDNSVSFSSPGSNYKSLTVNENTPLDPKAKKIIDDANVTIAPVFNEVIGHLAADLTSQQAAQPFGESQLGNWMSDVIKTYAQADVGLVNNGGIRLSPIPAGDITVGTIFILMPFDNTITTVSATGTQFKTILEQAVQDKGKGIQVSGIKFTYDSSKASGQRITQIVRESDNTVVKDTDVLKVAAPDFLATGGDLFTEFTDPAIKATLNDSHYLVRDALIADVRKNGTIPTVMNNRITNASGSGTVTEKTIAQAREAGTGTVTLTGVVTTVNDKNVFIQDDTAGICLYNTAGATVQKGDRIKVTGPLSVWNGLTEITPVKAADVQVLSFNNTVAPKAVAINQINESLEGQLVKLQGVTIKTIDPSGESLLEDSTGSIVIYKVPQLTGIAPGDKVDVTAAVGQYNTKYELWVGAAADVVKTGSEPIPAAKISILATSDLHGNIYNYDYATGAAPSKGQGLAKVSSYVKSVRAANPNNVMLIDNGDTIQGTPLSYYYNMIDKTSENPMMKVMGAMGYDAWTLGNHEYNYGLDTLNRIIGDATNEQINVLSANTYKTDGTNYVKPYITKSFTVNGKTIKVGILGLTTKTIPNWEDASHYDGLHFNDLADEAKKWVPILKNTESCDIVVVSAHSGEEGASDTIPENQIKAIASAVNGIDAIVAGHAHSVLNDLSLKNPDGKVVPVLEPGKWGNQVSQIDINVDETGTVTGVATKNVVMDNAYPEDPAIAALAQPYQDQALQYIQTVLGTSKGEFKGAGQYVVPTAIMDLVNEVQKDSAATQLSIAAPLSATAYIPQGNVTIKDIMSVYVYENFLYGVKMTGKQLKSWMEYSVRYYKQINDPNLVINGTTNYKDLKDTVLNIADYNLDQLYGATYDIDLTEAACTIDAATGRVLSGKRIKNLKVNGTLVKDTDEFTVAINNYRYNGGGGFMKAVGLSSTDPSIVTYDSAKKLGDDGQVRSLMMNYIKALGTIDPTVSNNWKLSAVPVAGQGNPNVLSAILPTGDKIIVGSGESTNVTVKALGANNLYGFDFTFSYDSQLFELSEVSLDPEFGSERVNATLMKSEVSNGGVRVIGTRLGQVSGISGDKGLVRFVLKAKNQDAATKFAVLNGAAFSDADGHLTATHADNEADTIIANADITGNGVQIDDAVQVAKYYGLQNNQTGYSSRLDMNKDGTLDIFDVSYVIRKMLAA